MTIEIPTGGKPPSNRLRRLLIASLAINLLLVGAALGAVWRARHHGFPGFGNDLGMMGFVRQLPSDRQPGIRDQLTAERQALRPFRREVRETWNAANAQLAAEPFDKGKLQGAMAQSRAAATKFDEAISTALISIAEKLSPEERKLLKEWRDHHRPHGFARHGHKGEGAKGDPAGDGSDTGRDEKD